MAQNKCIREFHIGLCLFKGAQSYFFNFFSNFLRFRYQKRTHIFLITHKKVYGKMVFSWEDSSERVISYGNYN